MTEQSDRWGVNTPEGRAAMDEVLAEMRAKHDRARAVRPVTMLRLLWERARAKLVAWLDWTIGNEDGMTLAGVPAVAGLALQSDVAAVPAVAGLTRQADVGVVPT